MISSPRPTAESELAKPGPISPGLRAYFQARMRNRLYNFIVAKFTDQKISQADLARRIGRRPDVINRLLGAPGNWTIDTVSDLLLGLGAEELEPTSVPLLGRPPRNYQGPYRNAPVEGPAERYAHATAANAEAQTIAARDAVYGMRLSVREGAASHGAYRGNDQEAGR